MRRKDKDVNHSIAASSILSKKKKNKQNASVTTLDYELSSSDEEIQETTS